MLRAEYFNPVFIIFIFFAFLLFILFSPIILLFYIFSKLYKLLSNNVFGFFEHIRLYFVVICVACLIKFLPFLEIDVIGVNPIFIDKNITCEIINKKKRNFKKPSNFFVSKLKR